LVARPTITPTGVVVIAASVRRYATEEHDTEDNTASEQHLLHVVHIDICDDIS
jgi:hypothetical protein